MGDNNIIAVAQNNRVYNKGYGIWIAGHLSILKNNYVENTAKIGISVSGLQSHLPMPPGYQPGGISIIEDNICVDCGRTEGAISIDYGSTEPLVSGIGIIRNNLIISRLYNIAIPLGAVNVAHVIIEGNKVEGRVSNRIIGIGSPNPAKHVEIRNNVINVEAVGSLLEPNIIAESIVFENNIINIVSKLNQNLDTKIKLTGSRMLIRGNSVNIICPTGYYTTYMININALGATDLVAHILDNYFDVPVNPGWPSAISSYARSSAVNHYIWIERNYIKSTTLNNAFLGLGGVNDNVTYHVYVRDNKILGTLKNRIHVWNDTDGKITTAIVYDDIEVGIPYRGAYKYGKRKSGIAIFSGNGTNKQFMIPHNLISKPNKVVVTPGSPDASANFYVTADDTYIYVNYTIAPPAGTNNIILYWYAEI
jgi:hypothetical protein